MLVAVEPVAARAAGPAARAADGGRSSSCARELAAAYDEAGHGFQLVKVAGGYRYQTHADLAPYVERFLLDGQRARLSGAALETLAIVAYKQPISRAQIASIRGVDPDGVLRTLQARGYVTEVARDPGPGQAVLFGTTPHVPREARARLARRPAADRRVRARRRRGRGARARAAHRRLPTHPADPTDRRSSSRRSGSSGRPRTQRCPQGERLQKVLAARGWGSRRVCEDLIAAGRVTVNGEVAVLGRRVDADTTSSRSTVCRSASSPASSTTCSTSRPASSPRPATPTAGRRWSSWCPTEPRVFPVGRLDVDTEGLLLLTNDGELAHRLTHPSHGVEKEYLAEVDGRQRRARARCAGCARASSSTTG